MLGYKAAFGAGWLAMLSLATPSCAQQAAPQPFNASSIATSPIVEQMLQGSKQGGAVVELQGYVGPSTPETVTLYSDLSLSRYWEIPRSGILLEVPGGDPKKDPSKLYLRSSTMVASASRITADTAVTQKAIIDELGNIPGERTPPSTRPGGLRLAAGGVCVSICAPCLIGGSGGMCLMCLDCIHLQ